MSFLKRIHVQIEANRAILTLLLFLSLSILAIGQESPKSSGQYYNLGVEAIGNQQYGDAVFYLEKARLLSPKADDINTNLRLAKQNLEADIVELEPFFLARWWQGFYELLPPLGWKLLTVLGFIAIAWLVWKMLLKTADSKKQNAWVLAAVAVATLVVFLVGIQREQMIYESPYAIANNKAEQLKEGPDPVSDDVKAISSGTKLEILDSYEDWLKVSAMDKEQGWIRAEQVRKLSF